ncbi:MAG: MFS transporter [Streptosporangiales bacterium]|nr:MFS transporter [Streptosporangiales bacterium]
MGAESRHRRDPSGPARETLVIRNPRDVYNFINDTPRKATRNRLMIFTALASLLVDGWDTAGLSAGVPSLVETFELSAFETGLLTSSIGFGMLFAAFVGGHLVDRIGRLRMFLLDMVLFVVAAIIGALAPNFAMVVVARFLMGVGIGIDVPAAMSVVAEQTNTRRKRTFVNQHMLFFYYAIVGSYLISWLLLEVGGVGNSLWRWQMAIGGVLAFIIIVTRLTVAEETAFWLASRGHLRSAAGVIEKVYGVKVTIEAPAQPRAERRIPFTYFFRGKYLKRTILSTEINFFQSLVYFAVGFYLPVTAGVLFDDPAVALLGTAAVQCAGLVGAVFASVFANRVGLRRETLIGFGVEVPALVVIGIGVVQGWMPPFVGIVVLAIFLMAHTLGPAQTGVSIAVLSYPTEMRGRGTGLSYGVGRIGAIAGFYVFPLLLAPLGLGNTLLLLALAPLFGFLIALFVKWDPTGATSETEESDEPGEPTGRPVGEGAAR